MPAEGGRFVVVGDDFPGAIGHRTVRLRGTMTSVLHGARNRSIDALQSRHFLLAAYVGPWYGNPEAEASGRRTRG